MRIARTAALQADINVTPLVDVCLVLLIIFMIVIPAMVNGIDVALPEAGTGDPVANRPLQITVNANRILYVGDDVIRIEELASTLDRIRATGAGRPVIVRGDKSLPYSEIVAVLSACRTAGFEDVGLGVEAP